MASLFRTIFLLLIVGMSGLVHSQIRMESGLPRFPTTRGVYSPFDIDDLWKTYSYSKDPALVGRVISTAALPRQGLETFSGPVAPDDLNDTPSLHSREEIQRIARQHFTIGSARWSLSYYVAQNPVVAGIVRAKLKTASGNERYVLDVVLNHPPRASTYEEALKLEMRERRATQKATPVSSSDQIVPSHVSLAPRAKGNN